MSKRYKLAVISIGEHVQRNVLPVFSRIDSLELSGVFSRNSVLLNEIAQVYNLKVYKSVDELLNDKSIDIVYIASPNKYHHIYSMQAVKAKKHVFCEKPLALEKREFEALLANAEKENVKIFEGFMFAYHEQYKRLLDLLKDDKIGKVFSIYARFGFPHLKRDNIRYSKKLGGGAYFDAAGYPIKLINMLMRKKPNNIASNLFQESDYEVDTGGSCLLNYDDGLNAFLDWGFGRAYKNEVEIWASNAVVRLNRFFSKPETLDTVIKIQYSDGTLYEEKIAGMNHFVAMYQEYVNCLEDGQKYQNYLETLMLHQNIYFDILDVSKHNLVFKSYNKLMESR